MTEITLLRCKATTNQTTVFHYPVDDDLGSAFWLIGYGVSSERVVRAHTNQPTPIWNPRFEMAAVCSVFAHPSHQKETQKQEGCCQIQAQKSTFLS
jgi:hypothetical protein